MAGYHFRNFVFEGGGVKGIAYVGALEELDKMGVLKGITRVGGTSAGAITAVLVGLNFSTNEIRDILWDLNFKKFLDDSFGVIRDLNRFIKDFGWYKGKYFKKWIGNLIKEKTGDKDTTFKQAQDMKFTRGFRDIYLVGTNLSTRFSEVFSVEKTPDMPIRNAVRISMSIPFFFKAVRMDDSDVYVDGGVLRNYPVKLFDRLRYLEDEPDMARHTEYYEKLNEQLAQEDPGASPYVFNKQTIGFRLDTKEEIAVFRDHAPPKRHEIKDLFDYIVNLMTTMEDAQSNSHLHSDDWQRTIYIDSLGVKTTDFNISDEKKRALVESGRKGVIDYFKWFNSTESAANK